MMSHLVVNGAEFAIVGGTLVFKLWICACISNHILLRQGSIIELELLSTQYTIVHMQKDQLL